MGRNRTVLFVMLVVAQFAQGAQYSMITVGFSSMMDDLNTSLRWVGWVFSIFLIGQVVAQPLSGWLVGWLGARNAYSASLLLGAVASLAAAFAPSVFVLIGIRVVQGMAAGISFPTSISVINELYGENRARPIGIQSTVMSSSSAMGPVVGGALIDLFNWRATFIFTPIILLALVGPLQAWLPAGRREKRRSVDWRGVVLIAVAMMTLIYGLTELGRRSGETNLMVVGVGLGLAAVLLTVLYRHEVRTRDPVIEMDLVTRREFVPVNILSLGIQVGHLGVFSVLPMYAQMAYGQSATGSGAVLGPRSVMQGMGAALATMLLFRVGYRRILSLSLVGMGVCIIVISLGLQNPSIAGLHIPGFVWLILVATGLGFFTGLHMPTLANAALDLAPDRIPQISGIRATFGTVGGAIGVAFASVMASRAASPTAGIEAAFLAVGVLYFVLAFVALRVPDGPPRRTEQQHPQAEDEPASE